MHVLLVCCSAEHLPFPAGTFDGAVGVHLLEHTEDPQAALSGMVRALKAGGLCFLSTPNRWSLGPEPCVRVWGVGFLPRSIAPLWVRLIKRVPYRNIHLLSALELRQTLARAGLGEWTISAPRLTACETRNVSGLMRSLVPLYHQVRGYRLGAALLQLFGPVLQVVGRK
jgi:SAM-dependent methyltransferase